MIGDDVNNDNDYYGHDNDGDDDDDDEYYDDDDDEGDDDHGHNDDAAVSVAGHIVRCVLMKFGRTMSTRAKVVPPCDDRCC